MADYSPGIRSATGTAGVVGALRGISLGGPTSWLGDGTFGRHLQTGLERENTEGTATAPSLRLKWPGFWRFRWAVSTGARTVTVYCKQAINQTPYPKIVIKANPDVGLAADVTASAGAGSDWKTITAAFAATAAGVVWVELHNALPAGAYDCFFDRISTT